MGAYTATSRSIVRLAAAWLGESKPTTEMVPSISAKVGVCQAEVVDVLTRNDLLPSPARRAFRAHVKKNGYGRGKRSPLEPKIVRLTKQGMSGAEIALVIGMGRGAIYRIQKRNKLPTDGSYAKSNGTSTADQSGDNDVSS